MAIARSARGSRTPEGLQERQNGVLRRGRVGAIPHPQTGEATPVPGLRERKKVKLRQQIINTAIRLFRKHGYENTRVEDIVQVLEISQPTFFRYFPSKDAVVRDVGLRGIACITGQLRSELASEASTAEHLRRLYGSLARMTEADRPLWRAVVLSGAMDPVRSPEMRNHDAIARGLLREILSQGQKRGEVTRDFPIVHQAEFMEGLYRTVVRNWALDITGPHKLAERVRSAVEFFLRAIES
jgi:AcrR family transcriptional regulator